MAEQKSKFSQVASDKTQSKVKNINIMEASNKVAAPLKAILAGFVIVLVYVLITKAKVIFSPEKIGNPKLDLGPLITGVLFTMALFIIIKNDLELATSNMAYSTFSLARKEVKIKPFLALIIGTLLYNFLGALIAAGLLNFSGVISPAFIEAMDHVTETKINLSFSQQFFSGIFANFSIGIAVLIYLESEEDLGKVLGLFVGVFIFAFLGFEHVVANGAIFISNMIFHPAMINFEFLLKVSQNIIAAFMGNLVGGGVIIGVGQALIYRRSK